MVNLWVGLPLCQTAAFPPRAQVNLAFPHQVLAEWSVGFGKPPPFRKKGTPTPPRRPSPATQIRSESSFRSPVCFSLADRVSAKHAVVAGGGVVAEEVRDRVRVEARAAVGGEVESAADAQTGAAAGPGRSAARLVVREGGA